MRRVRLIALALTLSQVPANAFELDWPVDCTAGKNCWIQQYPDHDVSGDRADYMCGLQSYDGHDGTDIRLRTTADEAHVLAAADGTVRGVRDGVPDRLVKSEADRAAIAKIECGNGVLIGHGDGWQTQYCHMKRGSVAVKRGEKVTAGQALGAVGYSGDAAFPHLHLSVRKGGEHIDPFSGPMSNPCAAPDADIWSEAAKSQTAYMDRTLLQLGFSDRKIDLDDLETGRLPTLVLQQTTPALVGFGWAINMKAGDRIILTVNGPQGEITRNETTLDRAKAQYLLFAGDKAPATGWQPGKYTIKFTVTAAGQVALSDEVTVDLR